MKTYQECIKTFVRIKPLPPSQPSILSNNRHQIHITKTKETFQFNQVFGQKTSNIFIFQRTMLPVIDHLLQGYNACILAYGQTASGKTYTMRGQSNQFGIIPLSIKQIFQRIQKLNLVAKVNISYFEIYNQNIIDLLSTQQPPKYLEVRDDGKKNSIIQDLIQSQVTNQHHSLEIYESGQARRKFASNNININSSRSHSIFRITVEVVHQNFQQSRATLMLVDLAGSECISRTNAQGILKKEGQNINKSLLYLSNVIRGLSTKNNYVNFRDSRLTRILQPCLTNSAKTIVICTIQQQQQCLGQTINTLKFGVAANTVIVTNKRNVQQTQSKIENDEAKHEELYEFLKQQRAEKQQLLRKLMMKQQQIIKIKKQNQIKIQQLQHHLLYQQNKNIHNNILITSLNREKQLQKTKSHDILNRNKSDMSIFQKQITQCQDKIKALIIDNNILKKQNKQLTQNQKTLLDKIARYQQQLEKLKNNMNKDNFKQNKKNILDTQRSKFSIGKQNLKQSRQSKDNSFYSLNQPIGNHVSEPYTIGKVIQLSTKILDLRLKLSQYINSNAILQDELLKTQQKLQFLQKNKLQGIAIQRPQQLPGSNRTNTTRVSQKFSKISDSHLMKIQNEVKQLKKQKSKLNKQLAQMRKALKIQSQHSIQGLYGFNEFMQQHLSKNQKVHFQFMFKQPAENYAPIPVELHQSSMKY